MIFGKKAGILICGLCYAQLLFAQAQYQTPQNVTSGSVAQANEPDWMKLDVVQNGQKQEASKIANEFNLSDAYVAGSNVHQGNLSFGNLSENHFNLTYVASIPVTPNWQFRLGVMYDRYDFGMPAGAPLPDTLGAAALVIGADINLSDKWLMRIEARPGVYSDFKNVTFDQVNVPIIIGFTYLVNSDLQWFFGIQIDPHFGTGIYHWDDSPVIPGFGVRWHFADKWTLMAVLPDPELQYDVTKDLQLYVGARLRGGNYRMSDNFGKGVGQSDLDKANLSYREFYTGLGVRYTFLPGFTLEAEGGAAVARQFYYSGPGLQIHADPAGYGQLQLKAQF